MGEKNKAEKIENMEVTISHIELKMNPKVPGRVYKVTFGTDKGNITWKPKVKRNEFRHGLEIVRMEEIDIENLPARLLKMGKEIQEKGHLKMKVVYLKMEGEMEGCSKEYRFITSEKHFDSWVRIKEQSEEKI